GRLAFRLAREHADDAERRVQLVDRAVGDDPRRVLRNASLADEVRIAVVASARVDARDADRHQRFFASSAYVRPAGAPFATGSPESFQPRAAGEPPNPSATFETSTKPRATSISAACCERMPD